MAPKLRFNETKNTTYSTVTLGDVVQSISSGRSKDCVENGNYKFYGSTGIIGFRSTADYEGTAILIARVGANAGSLYMVNGKYNVSDNTLIVSADSQFTNYLYFYLSAINLNKLVYGSGQPLITGGMLKNLKIEIPGTKEQIKIADFLASVDVKIKLLNKQYDLLCRYKKEMLQKVFSQVLRFKDESGEEFPEWEPKQLSDIAMINPKNKELPSEFIYIDLESVEKGQLLKEQLIRKNDAPSRAQRLLSPGDVLFQLVRPYQKNNYIFFLSGNYVASTGYAQLRANYNPHFLYQLLHLESFTSEVMNRCTGTSYPAINSSDLASIEIEIPSEKEQIKIASFLSAIDDKIAIKKAELDRLKNWKQGLLQQMFV